MSVVQPGTPSDLHHDHIDIDVRGLWATSGAQWLTTAGVAVPGDLVRRVVSIVADLDAAGAGVAAAVRSRGLGVLAERAAAVGLPPSSSTSAGGSCRVFATSAGTCAVSLARRSDFDLVPAWLEVTVVAGDEQSAWQAVADTFVSSGPDRVADLLTRATLLGLAVAMEGEAASSSHPVLAQRVGNASTKPVRGAVVVNLGSLWAAPLAGATLAAMGARVIKVESASRPDGARRHAVFFNSLHDGCESVALDLAHPAGQAQLSRLLERADVVIEGSRPRALAQMGIDAQTIASHGPQVWMSITGHGRDTENEHRIGFGDDAAIAGGLVGRSPGARAPVFVADAVADPLAGLTVAHSIVGHLASGGRWLVDVALARVAASTTGEWVPPLPMDAAARPQRRAGGRVPGSPLGSDTQVVLDEFDVGG